MMLLSTTLQAAQYIIIDTDSADIRLKPSETSQLISTIKRPAILEIRGEELGWKKVVAPSGDYRYILSRFTRSIDTIPAFTPPSNMRSFCSELVQAERKAREDAEKTEPDLIKQIDLQRVFVDQYKIPLFAKYDLHPIHNTKATVWCVTTPK